MSVEQRSRASRLEAYRDWLVIACVNHGLLTVLSQVNLPIWGATLIGLPLGVGFAMGAVTVLHNAGHHRYSPRYWPNMLVVQTAMPIGLWVSHWTLKHLVHHRLPAVYPDDSFTDTAGWLRVHPAAPLHAVHRFQHWYAWGLYALAWPIELISQVAYLITGDVPGLARTPGALRRVASYVPEKAVSVAIMAVYLGLGRGEQLLVALPIAVITAGLLVTTVIAVGHINLGLRYDLPDDVRRDWRRYVTATTASFGVRNRALAWVTGGLTHHLAHHLRPAASRPELRAMHGDLRNGPDIVEFPTLSAAIRGHREALRVLGHGANHVSVAVGRTREAAYRQ